jgi:UDP-N-acetylmuramoyl-tripeptide--D-alanyl-D-alanine ligase
VVTLVALEHYKAFRSLDAVAEEKQKLVEALPENGLAILNHDDPRVIAMASRTQARVVTFGALGGDYRITGTQAPAPGALAVTISHAGTEFEVRTRLTGAHNNLVVVAAFACAHQLGVPTSTIVDRLSSFQPVFGRCSAHFVESGPVFIVDTVKAPYHSIYLPINMMAEFVAPRKRIVIGKISDYSGNPHPKYRDVYRASRQVADQVIFVGDDAHRSTATAEDIEAGRFVEKRTLEEAAEFVRKTAIPGEIILLKSSGYLHLERVFINFESPVRCWVRTCGKRKDCLSCGSHTIPFGLGKKKRGKDKWRRSEVEPAPSPGSAGRLVGPSRRLAH